MIVYVVYIDKGKMSINDNPLKHDIVHCLI